MKKKPPKEEKYKIIIGGSLREDLKAFKNAWKRADRGERVRERVLAFESWEALASVMTPARYKLLLHLRRHPTRSISSLARGLKRHYRRVHADVTALENAGLLARSKDGLRTTTDAIKTTIHF